ncbi:SDH6 Succinate dehydrogenase assembly factor 1 [Candida maltosa Xu316]|uniref:Complex 1 LYR protein domain-containing protein n=1 Tax=Candida maltosa (strain Xu316) TaxID=1245528 RepID=M3K0X2_CANMX|nr:hypothetical protein G210_1075 [Candida maltosa Xu316]
MARLSGLQKDVIHLYRQCIRTVKTKPRDTQPHWKNFIHEEFNKYKKLPKKEFNTIEYLLRTGHKKLEMYSNPQLKDIH